MNIPICKGRFLLSFMRAEDDHAMHRFMTNNDANTLANAGKIVISEFVIRVPVTEFKMTSNIHWLMSWRICILQDSILHSSILVMYWVKGSNWNDNEYL